jgi:hypothetical protein
MHTAHLKVAEIDAGIQKTEALRANILICCIDANDLLVRRPRLSKVHAGDTFAVSETEAPPVNADLAIAA